MDGAGSQVAGISYYPYGGTRGSTGSLGTDRKFTGQRLDGTGLYYYGARYYDAELGRWTQPDAVVPNPGIPQSFNRYSYSYNNPLKYTDPSGHFPIPLLIGGLLLLKALDYAWTAWDSYESLKVINDPNASEADKAAAMANLAMAAAFEAAEPDEVLPISLPIDDLARHGIMGLGREAGQEAVEQGSKHFTENNFRDKLKALTGKAADEVKDMHAHHVLPRKFEDPFKKAGIDNIHDPRFGSWVKAEPHPKWSGRYNDQWEKFLKDNPTREEILEFARELAKEYDFDVNFDIPGL